MQALFLVFLQTALVSDLFMRLKSERSDIGGSLMMLVDDKNTSPPYRFAWFAKSYFIVQHLGAVRTHDFMPEDAKYEL